MGRPLITMKPRYQIRRSPGSSRYRGSWTVGGIALLQGVPNTGVVVLGGHAWLRPGVSPLRCRRWLPTHHGGSLDTGGGPVNKKNRTACGGGGGPGSSTLTPRRGPVFEAGCGSARTDFRMVATSGIEPATPRLQRGASTSSASWPGGGRCGGRTHPALSDLSLSRRARYRSGNLPKMAGDQGLEPCKRRFGDVAVPCTTPLVPAAGFAPARSREQQALDLPRLLLRHAGSNGPRCETRTHPSLRTTPSEGAASAASPTGDGGERRSRTDPARRPRRASNASAHLALALQDGTGRRL